MSALDHNAQQIWSDGWDMPSMSAFVRIEAAGHVVLTDAQRGAVQWACCKYFAAASQARQAKRTNRGKTDALKLVQKIGKRLAVAREATADLPELLAELDALRSANPELVDGIERAIGLDLSTVRYGMLELGAAETYRDGLSALDDAVTYALEHCAGRRPRDYMLDAFLVEIGAIYTEAGGRFGSNYSDELGNRDSPFCRFTMAIMDAAPQAFSGDIEYAKLAKRVEALASKQASSQPVAAVAVDERDDMLTGAIYALRVRRDERGTAVVIAA